jgi:hypothetical protein
MRDELRGFPREHEIGAALFAPGLDGQRRRSPIENAVEFGGLKLSGVVFQLLL